MKKPFRNRLHLFEFGDQTWLTGWLREAYLDCLNLGLRMGGQFDHIHQAIATWVGDPSGTSILDLGSGGAGPVETMIKRAREDSIPLPKFYLSDINPSLSHYQQLQELWGSSHIGFMAKPVSALAVEPRDIPLRSICSTLHHFDPNQAQKIVEDAVRNAQGIIVVEPLQRNLRHFLMVALSGPFPYWLAPFFAKRWSWLKFLFTSIIPLAPLMVAFDGCVSVLRTYTPDEIIAMVPLDHRNRVSIARGVCPYMRFFGSYYVAIRRIPI